MARFHPHAAKRNSDLFPDSVTGKTELQQQSRTEPAAGIYVMVWVADFAGSCSDTEVGCENCLQEKRYRTGTN
ncbi:hypothetical protein BT69DRAFT_472477 [Atractiella rhizophila]|nr:hypothetical protein BT69DRAFT_472477 [Atractiella rhizophila]